MRRMVTRWQMKWTAFLTGGSLLVLEGCEPAVRDTVLAGVEAAANGLAATFITAFFQTLQEPEETATTVRAIIEALPRIVA